MIIFFLLFVVFLLAFVEASAAKNLMLDYFCCIFCGAESSINAIDVVYISSGDSFSIFYPATA